jgi:murein DD-endopeptidase MepM/ murein hydrolase activator NlpD
MKLALLALLTALLSVLPTGALAQANGAGGQANGVDVRRLWVSRDALPEDSLFGQFRAYQESQRFITEPILQGEALDAFLVRMGMSAADAEEAAAVFLEESGLEKLDPGTAVRLKFRRAHVTPFQIEAGGWRRGLEAMEVLLPAGRLVALGRVPGGFEAATKLVEIEKRYVAAAGEIRNSLFASAFGAGVPRQMMIEFADVFAFDVDFVREIYAGDRFELVYEVLYDEQEREIGTGDIVFAALTWKGGRYSQGYYRFRPEGQAEGSYFSADGRDPRTLLMKTPINGARVTSRFGRRRHPVLGYTTGHKGIDFGAPTGTPIMAAGDGVLKLYGPRGTFGNYVRIDHGNGLETAYAHLSRFVPGLRIGSEVRQGEVIGYVGTTGRSTGPHLHYEVWSKNQPMNPETIKVAVGQALEGESLDEFRTAKARTDSLRIHPFTIASAETLP